MDLIFWILVFLVFYTYLGYGLFLYILVRIKRLFKKSDKSFSVDYKPSVTHLIAAFNEEDYIAAKINNSQNLDYPSGKIKTLIVTDGSDDTTATIVQSFPGILHTHKPERKGKIAAVDRAMEMVESDIVIFSDANTDLNPEAVSYIVRHFEDDKVGAVAGEKRILKKEKDKAAGAGEGIYWKYESKLKTWDSELYTVVGAAGELFAIRKSIFESVPKDSIIEDFYMTLRIAERGYRVVYEPKAYAVETASASVKDELKRKIRIAAGGIQSIVRLRSLLNPFKNFLLSFQYISHRVLRWTLTPLALPFIFLLNFLLLPISPFYEILFYLQILFYLLAILGFYLESKEIRIKILFVPYYFTMMNYAVYMGMGRYLKGSQSVVWEKAKRAS